MKINSLLIKFPGLKCTVKRSHLWKLVACEMPKSSIYQLTKISRITVSKTAKDYPSVSWHELEEHGQLPEVWCRDEYVATCKLTLKKKSWLKLLFFFSFCFVQVTVHLFLFFSVRIRPWPLRWVPGQGSLLPLSQGETFTLASISYLAILVKYILAIYSMWVESSSCGSGIASSSWRWSLAGRGGRGYSARKSSAERRREAMMIADRMPTSMSEIRIEWQVDCAGAETAWSTALHYMYISRALIFVTHAACGDSWWRPLVYCASLLVTREYLPMEQNTSLLAGGVGSSWSVKWSSFKFQWGTGIRWWMWLIFMGRHL